MAACKWGWHAGPMCSVAGTHARLGAAHARRAPSSEGLERPGRWPGGRESGCLQQPCCPGSAFPDRDRRPSLLWGTSRTGLAGMAPSLNRFKASPLCTPSGLSWAIKHFKVTQHPATGPECSLLSPRHRRLGTDALGSPSAHGPVHFSPAGLRGRVSCCRTAVPPGSLLNSHCPKSPKWLCKGHTHRPPLFLAYRPTKPPGIKPDP